MDDGTEPIVRFWGARGSIAAPGPDTIKYGGNTSCVEVRCGGRTLVFDAGTGIRALGDTLCRQGDGQVDLFLSHTHLDHIVGFPFFRFAYESTKTVRLWAGHLLPERTIEGVLRALMAAPFFPVSLDIMSARIEFRDFNAGETLRPGDEVVIRTAALDHPDRATGYRVEYNGKSVCYVTDTRHIEGAPSREILDLIADADIVIYDAMFTDDEFSNFRDWGHSTWEECLRLCKAANARIPVIFHHLPSRDDRALDAIADEVARRCPGAVVAREGETLVP